MRRSLAVLSVTVIAFAAGARAQPTAPAAPPPCAAPAHHEFDFWIGDWDVTTPDGKPAGTNRIESVLGGCALLEHWEGQEGGAGKSLTLYVTADRQWNQTWVDATGNRVVLTGGLDGARMVLRNAWTAPGGARMRSELSWTPAPDGSVRQVWRQSRDDGATYQTTFDGIYRRRARR